MLRRAVANVGLILESLQHTRCLSLTAYKFTEQQDSTRHRTTHFGFETVTEAEKGNKGSFLPREAAMLARY